MVDVAEYLGLSRGEFAEDVSEVDLSDTFDVQPKMH